jgi:hypothetical protein
MGFLFLSGVGVTFDDGLVLALNPLLVDGSQVGLEGVVAGTGVGDLS